MGVTCIIWTEKNSWEFFFSEVAGRTLKYTGMLLGLPFSKTVHKILICEKTWLWYWGLLELYKHEEILKNLILLNCWLDFELFSQRYSFCDPFQKLLVKFQSIRNIGLVHGAYFHYTDMKKFLKSFINQPPRHTHKKKKKNRLWSSEKFRWAIQGHLV